MDMLTVKFEVKIDPLFDEMRRLCEKSEIFGDKVQRLIDDDNLIHVLVGRMMEDEDANKLPTQIHLTDAALELIYREKVKWLTARVK